MGVSVNCRVRFVIVLIMRAVLFDVCSTAPVFWQLLHVGGVSILESPGAMSTL